MLTHRFRELIAASVPSAPFAGAAPCGFVACPLFMAFSPLQQSHIQDIYRIAAARTRDQHAARPRCRQPAFSRN
jgi:hypothetical protein